MSDSEQQRPAPTPPPAPPSSALGNTPNAEKYVLEADAMRRRQLRSALLHGSRRTWREHKRAWPPVAVGFVVVAVIIAGMAVKDALDVTQENQKEKEREQQEQIEQRQKQSSAPVSPSALPSSPPGRGAWRAEAGPVYVDLRSLCVGDQLLRPSDT